MRQSRVVFKTRLAAAFAAALVVNGCTTQAESTAPPAAIPQVSVVPAEERAIQPVVQFTGRVEPIHRVDLRPRVSGAIEAVLFREGATIQAGTPLFQLDRRPFAIAVDRAAGEVAAAESQLRRARSEFERADRLVKEDAIASEEVVRRQSEVETLTARVDAARAAHAEALLNLEFTRVIAPVGGRVGRAEVTPGNLVVGGPAHGTRLTRIHSIDPVYVYFDLDPATADEARHAPVRTWRAEVATFGRTATREGPVDFVDNGVSAQSGTLKVRARIANPDAALLPDAVVKVTFRYGDAQPQTVVPDIAIGTEDGERALLVVLGDGSLQKRVVTPGTNDGMWRVVPREAVSAGDLIVLPGRPGLRPGMKVEPVKEVLR